MGSKSYVLWLKTSILVKVFDVSGVRRGELPAVRGAHGARRAGRRAQRRTCQLQQS
jgi:hypothetical protein